MPRSAKANILNILKYIIQKNS